MNVADGEIFLIKHPDFGSFALVAIYGKWPDVFPEQFQKLLPGNQDGRHKGVEITNRHPYLDYLKQAWPEGFNGFENNPVEELGGITYRLVTKYVMM